MKKCPYCKEKVNKDASKCKHCKADLRSWPRKHPIITAILGLWVFTYAFYSGGSGTSTNSNSSSSSGRIEACTYAQIEVKARIKSPSTAEFPACIRQDINQIDGQEYKVNSYVDSQNSFGATTRTNYSCSVRLTDGDTYFVECTLL